MKTRVSADQPLYTFVDIPADALSQHHDVLQRIHDKQLDGVIVRGLVPPELLKAIIAKVEASDLPRLDLPDVEAHKEAPHTYGEAIVSAQCDLVEYFDLAATLRSQCKTLLADTIDLEELFRQTFVSLSGGAAVEVPQGPAGQTYCPITFRNLPEGHGIGVHVGNGFLEMPQAQHLASLVNDVDQISFFLTLSAPEGGGELVVYSLEHADVAGSGFATGYQADANGGGLVEILCDKTAFKPRPGDLLIFDGGRYYHRVSPTEGPEPRRTVGGFLAWSRAHDRIYFWS